MQQKKRPRQKKSRTRHRWQGSGSFSAVFPGSSASPACDNFHFLNRCVFFSGSENGGSRRRLRLAGIGGSDAGACAGAARVRCVCKTEVVRRLLLDRGQPVLLGRAETYLTRHGQAFRDGVAPQGLNHPSPVVQERVERFPEDGSDPSPCDELLEEVGDQHEADVGLGRDRVLAVHVFQSEACIRPADSGKNINELGNLELAGELKGKKRTDGGGGGGGDEGGVG